MFQSSIRCACGRAESRVVRGLWEVAEAEAAMVVVSGGGARRQVSERAQSLRRPNTDGGTGYSRFSFFSFILSFFFCFFRPCACTHARGDHSDKTKKGVWETNLLRASSPLLGVRNHILPTRSGAHSHPAPSASLPCAQAPSASPCRPLLISSMCAAGSPARS